MDYSRIYQFTPSGTEGELVLDTALPSSNDDDAHHILFDSFRAVFHTHARRQFGGFDAESPNAMLHVGAHDYRDQKIDAENLGLKLAQHLKHEINSCAQQQPWYLWFIIERSGDDQLIYLFLFKHDVNHHISTHQTVAVGNTIQPGQLQYAAKLSLTEWQSTQSKTYLSYLTPKNQHPITLAWSALIGFAQGADRAVQTEELLTAIERYADELPLEKQQDYRARVVDYCLDQDRIGEPVAIKDLSRHANEETPEALLQFLQERIEDPAPALYADRKQLKRYTRFYGRDNDLSIGFSTLMLGRNIIYDESTETLTIRAIPKALKSQLARHARKPE